MHLVLAVLLASTIPTCANDPASAPAPSESSTTTSAPHQDLMKLFYHEVNKFINLACRPILTSDAMLVVAVLMVLQWHVRHFFPKYTCVEFLNKRFGLPTRLVRKLGLNVWILQFYYDPDMPECIKKRRFVCSCWLVFVDNVIVYYFFQLLSRRCLGVETTADDAAQENYIELDDGNHLVSWGDPRWEDEEEGEGDEDDPVTSKYMDLTYPIRRLFPMFIIQGALLLLYVDNLNSDDDTKDIEKVKFSYWIVGVLLQLYAGDRQLGDAYNKNYWDALDKSVLKDQKHCVFNTCSLTYGTEWDMRNFMDFTINSVCRLIIMFTFPIMLCVEEPLDFVKDCTAVFFMTTLDDLELDDYKTVPQMMIQLKFNLLYEKILHHPGECHNGLPEIPVNLTKNEARIAEKPKRGDTDRFTRQRAYKLKLAGSGEFEILSHLIKHAEPEDAMYGTSTQRTVGAIASTP